MLLFFCGRTHVQMICDSDTEVKQFSAESLHGKLFLTRFISLFCETPSTERVFTSALIWEIFKLDIFNKMEDKYTVNKTIFTVKQIIKIFFALRYNH